MRKREIEPYPSLYLSLLSVSLSPFLHPMPLGLLHFLFSIYLSLYTFPFYPVSFYFGLEEESGGEVEEEFPCSLAPSTPLPLPLPLPFLPPLSQWAQGVEGLSPYLLHLPPLPSLLPLPLSSIPSLLLFFLSLYLCLFFLQTNGPKVFKTSLLTFSTFPYASPSSSTPYPVHLVFFFNP